MCVLVFCGRHVLASGCDGSSPPVLLLGPCRCHGRPRPGLEVPFALGLRWAAWLRKHELASSHAVRQRMEQEVLGVFCKTYSQKNNQGLGMRRE